MTREDANPVHICPPSIRYRPRAVPRRLCSRASPAVWCCGQRRGTANIGNQVVRAVCAALGPGNFWDCAWPPPLECQPVQVFEGCRSSFTRLASESRHSEGPGGRCTAFYLGPGTASGIPHRPPAGPFSLLCASPWHPSGLAGLRCIHFRHLYPKVLVPPVLETFKDSVKFAIVASFQSRFFHNLSNLHCLPIESCPGRDIPWLSLEYLREYGTYTHIAARLDSGEQHLSWDQMGRKYIDPGWNVFAA